MLDSFPHFMELSAELRNIIWENVASDGGQRTITVILDRMPYYQKATYRRDTGKRSTPSRIRYRYRCHAPQPFGVKDACRESRAITLHPNPDTLHLYRQQVIYFNAECDRIFFDHTSLLTLYDLMINGAARRRSQGFHLIRNILTPLTHHVRGLRSMKSLGLLPVFIYHGLVSVPNVPSSMIAIERLRELVGDRLGALEAYYNHPKQVELIRNQIDMEMAILGWFFS